VLYRYFADTDELHAAVGNWAADKVLEHYKAMESEARQHAVREEWVPYRHCLGLRSWWAEVHSLRFVLPRKKPTSMLYLRS
jgi:hypothetical protein